MMHRVGERSWKREASSGKEGGGAAVGLICARSTGSRQAGANAQEGTFWDFLGHLRLGRADVTRRTGGGRRGAVVGGGFAGRAHREPPIGLGGGARMGP